MSSARRAGGGVGGGGGGGGGGGASSTASAGGASAHAADAVQIKLLLIGDSSVGKTSLLLRYVDDKFSPSFVSTIGIDFKVKRVRVDGTDVRLQLWDTAGQERFRTITTSYFRGAQGILVVFDMTSRSSFASVANWVAQLRDTVAAAEADGGGVALVLAGTKSDLADKLQVTEAEGSALAAQYGMRFFATSAKFNSGVAEVFDVLAREALAKLMAVALPPKAAAAAAAKVNLESGAGAAGGGGGGGACGKC